MQEKLSVKKVYIDALHYVVTHLGAFTFLTVFYFLGSLMPMFIGTTSFKILMIPYYYLFLYFAAGCYYKQKILWDIHIFFVATVRFFTAVLLFVAILSLSSYLINFGFGFISDFLFGGKLVVGLIIKSATWQIIKYLLMFILVIVFFVIPSFAFVSEISGKNRSLLMTYVKTKGNIIQIGAIIFISFLILVLALFPLKYISPIFVELIRTILLVFYSIVYFKMYDFFYSSVTHGKTEKKKKSEPEQKEILLADAKTSKKDTNDGDTKSETSKEKK